LLAAYKDGRARFNAYLDDYAFLIDGILELLQARWRDGDLDFAVALADTLLAHYQDHQHGGFFFTADDHEALIHRPKPYSDEATPAGNGVAAQVLGRLGHLLNDQRYLAAAAGTLQAAWTTLSDLPYAHDSLLAALEDQLYPPQLIVLRGESGPLRIWQARAGRFYAPRRYTLAIPNDARTLPGALAECSARGAVTAYVCTGTQCSAPISELNALEAELGKTEVVA